jgi:hypothetical protein
MGIFSTVFGKDLAFDTRAVIASPTKLNANGLNTSAINAESGSADSAAIMINGRIASRTGYFDANGINNIVLQGQVLDSEIIAGGSTERTSPIVAPNLGGTISAMDSTPLVIPGITDSDEIVVKSSSDDMRIRLRAGKTTSAIEQILGPNKPSENVLSILYETEGMLFPYTPAISVSQSVNWDPIALIQNNYDVNSYQRTPSVNISVTGTFTTQTQREGEYLMAVLHYLRTVTKSYFGVQDRASGKAGTPPPVLYFDGYGDFIFRYIPVVVKSYSYAFDEAVDSSIFTARSGHRAKLPAKMSITMELGMQVNMERQREEFSLDKFRTGALISEGGWF